MSNIPKQVFEIESIQEEQNEIDSINNSSRRFQGHIPVYPAQDTTYQNGGFSSYDQNQRQAQLNYIYQQQQNLNYMQNNNGNQLTPVQMYMKEKLIAYQNQSNQANSGSLIIHNEKLDTSSQITNTIDKNLEQHYQNIQSQNMMTSDGYEYTSPNVIVPQRLFQNAVQQNQLNSQNSQNIQQQQKLQQQQQQQQQQYLQQQQKLQQAQYQHQQNMNGNYQARDSTNQSNQTAQQQQQQQQYQLQMNQQQQLLQQQQMQLQQQQQYANVHDQLIDQQSSEEIQYINQSQQSINNNNFNSLRQSNTSVPSITKNYFVVNPVHESVKKMQDKLTHKPAVKQVQQQTKAKSRQNGKENSPNKNQNLQQEREQPTTNENEQSQNLQNLQNQVVQQQQLQAPKHIYLNLDQLNQASKKNSKSASVSNIKKATPLKQHPSKHSVNGDKHSSKAPSRQSQQSSVVNKNKNTSNRVSEQIYPPPPSKISSAATPQNEIQESVQNDEIDEYNLNQQQQIILNGSNEKKKVVNSLLDSKKTYLDVRTSKQKELIKHANQQQVIKQSLQDTLKNQQYTNGTSNNNNNNTNNQILDNEMQVADIYQLQQQQQITNHSQKEYKQEARLQNNSGNRTATPKAQQQSNLSNRKPSSQTLIASKSLPQFVTQESLANSAKERQNFEFITKGDKTVEIRSKDNSFAGSSSQFQSKLGSPHSVSTLQNNNKLNQSTYTQQQFGQSNYFGILTSPKTKLSEANFYKKETILERNDFWVKHTDTHKQLLNMHYVGEEMKECSFSPMFYTNNLNRKCAVKHQNLTQRVEQSLNPTFHKQAAQMKSSYSRLHNFKKEMGFIEQMIQQKPIGNNEQNQYDQANLEQYQ